MSKPLDLAIFEPSRCSCPCREPFWIDPRDGSQRPRHHFNSDQTVDRIDYDPAKRLTDAELAAEDWELQYGCEVSSEWGTDWEAMKREKEQRAIMHRFATLPHYDEQDQP